MAIGSPKAEDDSSFNRRVEKSWEGLYNVRKREAGMIMQSAFQVHCGSFASGSSLSLWSFVFNGVFIDCEWQSKNARWTVTLREDAPQGFYRVRVLVGISLTTSAMTSYAAIIFTSSSRLQVATWSSPTPPLLDLPLCEGTTVP